MATHGFRGREVVAFTRDDRGASAVEYILAIGFAVIIAWAGVTKLGGSVKNKSSALGDRVTSLEGAPSSPSSALADEGKAQREANVDASRATVCTGDGCNCFVAGTPVATTAGSRAIEDVRPGDRVLARDPESGEIAARIVVRTFVTPARPVLSMELASSRDVERVGVTAEHPFFVEERGWVRAGELRAGDRLTTERGALVTVGAVLEEAALAPVYNLEVEGFHTYFVGVSRALVHNDCQIGAAPAPQAGPRQDNSLAGPSRRSAPSSRPQYLVPMHPSWRAGDFANAFVGGSLDVNRVTVSMLENGGWTPSSYQQLMNRLSGESFRVTGDFGIIPWSGTKNGVNLLFGALTNAQGDGRSRIRARLVAAAPLVALESTTRTANNAGITPPQNIQHDTFRDVFAHWRVMFDDMSRLDGSPVPNPGSQQALAQLVQRALENGDGSSPTEAQMRERIATLTSGMLAEMRTPDEVGFTIGVLIAGIDRTVDAIGNRRQQRQIIEGGVFDGLAGIAGATPAGLILSPAIVALRTGRQLTDNELTGQGLSRRVLGAIEHEMNNQNARHQLPNGWNHQDLTVVNNRIREVLHNNGFNN